MKNKLKIFRDVERGGNLIPFEFSNMPFEPKRIFTVTDVLKDSIRGEHAHFQTQQILICVKGKIIVYLDNGKFIDEYVLEEGESIFIDKMIWDYQKFTTGNDVMVVISSTHYDINDYILNREQFYKLVNGE